MLCCKVSGDDPVPRISVALVTCSNILGFCFVCVFCFVCAESPLRKKRLFVKTAVDPSSSAFSAQPWAIPRAYAVTKYCRTASVGRRIEMSSKMWWKASSSSSRPASLITRRFCRRTLKSNVPVTEGATMNGALLVAGGSCLENNHKYTKMPKHMRQGVCGHVYICYLVLLSACNLRRARHARARNYLQRMPLVFCCDQQCS